MGNIVARRFVHSDFAATGDCVKLIPIPANSFVKELYFHVEEGFVGGTVVLIVGDDADPNGYLVDTEITEGTLNLVSSITMTAAAGAYLAATGARPFYTAADTIDVELAFSSATTAGIGVIIAEIVTIP